MAFESFPSCLSPGIPDHIHVYTKNSRYLYVEGNPKTEPNVEITAEQYRRHMTDPTVISHENHRRNFEAFIESLDSGQDFCINSSEAQKAVEVILAIYKSAGEHKAVKLG